MADKHGGSFSGEPGIIKEALNNEGLNSEKATSEKCVKGGAQ